ncbi:hypothetical protein BJX68DRAFT_126054 [Aspergillus pseudodeflectus]|uniref:Uncharacterized protein n=1 Tax=Aspergillus pseudodeflectus TaxID=176178 RepID=A0ABR4K1M9_9EURO
MIPPASPFPLPRIDRAKSIIYPFLFPLYTPSFPAFIFSIVYREPLSQRLFTCYKDYLLMRCLTRRTRADSCHTLFLFFTYTQGTYGTRLLLFVFFPPLVSSLGGRIWLGVFLSHVVICLSFLRHCLI